MKVIDVTCAIIRINGKTLVVQRSAEMKLPLKWEFPGGKVEAGESEEECVAREVLEELGIEIEVLERLTPSRFDYADFSIRLIPFVANHLAGEIQLKEHARYLLLDKGELRDLDWAEADVGIVEEYLNGEL